MYLSFGLPRFPGCVKRATEERALLSLTTYVNCIIILDDGRLRSLRSWEMGWRQMEHWVGHSSTSMLSAGLEPAATMQCTVSSCLFSGLRWSAAAYTMISVLEEAGQLYGWLTLSIHFDRF